MRRAILAGRRGRFGPAPLRGSSVTALGQFLKSFGAGRLAAMGVVTLALIGFFAFVIVRFTTPAMVPLFTDLSPQDAAAVVKELESQNVPYDLKNDGAGVLVKRG